MSEYNGNWKLFEGTKMNVVEVPIYGVYCIDNRRIQQPGFDYFVVEELSGKLTPTYVTKELDENGYNNFPCETIRESSQRNAEYY